MNTLIPSLNPLSFPLTGSHLIEASAGTGKTFTIAALYVRLILGHGGQNAFTQVQALTPPEILVVTFTDAATKELRDRIRARLTEAAEYFRADPATVVQQSCGENFLYDLRADYPPAQWLTCARKLQLASEWMDEAAVATIHSWCNRMLREHAFDSQSLFTQNLETDQSELFSEVVRDYWRIHFFPLTTADIEQIRAFWQQPSELEFALKKLVEHVELLAEQSTPIEYLAQVKADKQAKLAQLKQPWSVWVKEIKDLLDNARQHKQIDAKKYQPRWYEPWLNTIGNWATAPDQENFDIGSGWTSLSFANIQAAWKDAHPPTHPAFTALDPLRKALAELPNSKQGILAHAALWVAKAFAAVQQQRAQMGFNDLLTGLESALNGRYGERLAKVIRQQFPVALIDEFQDTDPVQYRIFEHIYEIAQNRQDCALIMIGDPKQAIYAFRGADIYTYLQARAAVQPRLYTLDTNFRSTTGMVEAVNHCFLSIENKPDSAGAFLFRQEMNNPVPFQAVKAKGRNEHFTVCNQAVPALTLAVLSSDENFNKNNYLAEMAEICATQIVIWLNQGQGHEAGFMNDTGKLTAIKPSDMAILVNNGKEAACIRQALARRGVRSVYLSDKESVYDTQPAQEISRWLLACSEPDNDRYLRAALSTRTLGLSLAELDALNQDEQAWEARVMQFKTYRQIWQNQGVLPMLRALLFDFACAERLLQQPSDENGLSGERLLTDLLHLAELLQQASYTLEGEHALIRFFAEQQAKSSNEADVKKVRLESDADLIKVVTIFKSKGLEYPVVFLPFICATRTIQDDDMPLKWHSQAGELQISLENSELFRSLADHERLGEDIRKVYVALTRARYTTWLGLAALDTTDISAIGYLLNLGDVPAEALLPSVHAFAASQRPIAVVTAMPVTHEKFMPKTTDAKLRPTLIPIRAAKEAWWISSYSSLRTEAYAPFASRPALSEDTPQAENLQEGKQELTPLLTADYTATDSVHRFFKGADAGTFLHDLMEWVAQFGFNAVLVNPTPLRETLARRCKLRHWEAWEESLVHWVLALLQTPLPLHAEPISELPTSITLKALQTYKIEMEFWFETHQVKLEHLDALVAAHTLGQRPRPKLLPDVWNGLLKGFIDLVFEYQGKYYVADYKSNWLGHHNESYSPTSLADTMIQHRYDLQYVIYIFALHRLLTSRLADYDYDRDIGGALYIFMRGIAAETAGVYFERPSKRLIEELDALFKNPMGETNESVD